MKTKLKDRIGAFTTIPNRFVEESHLSHEAFRIFIVLRRFSGANSDDAFPSYETLKAKTGIRHNKTIARAIRELELAGWLERRKRFGASTIYTITIPSPNDLLDDVSITSRREPQSVTPCTTVSHGVTTNKKQVIRNTEEERTTSSPVGEIKAGDAKNQTPTQPLEERKGVETAQVPPPAAAPARAPAPPRKPDPAQVKQADDLIAKHAERKAGGKLANWDITRNAIESAIKGNVREDKTAIDRACKMLGETICEIVNDYQWHFWPNRKSAMEIIKLDLHLDDVVAYVRADCDSIAAKYKERDGYGMENALQAVRIALAALSEKQQKAVANEGEYYETEDGEIRWRPKQ